MSGSQQALDLIARLCVRPGDGIALEDPGYPEAHRVLSASAGRRFYAPVDDEGIDVDSLVRMTRSLPAPRLLYVTPSHQFPTGATLSLPRRLALLDWAARRNVLIIEDDYDSEFRSPGRMIESLQGLDRAHRVIYVGTFSTILFPPLRIGYVVLPPEMVEAFVQAKWLADRQSPTLEQLALTDFLEEGHFERHLRKMRRLASARRDALRAALEEHLGKRVELSRPSAGMHLMIRLFRPPWGCTCVGVGKACGDRCGIARRRHLPGRAMLSPAAQGALIRAGLRGADGGAHQGGSRLARQIDRSAPYKGRESHVAGFRPSKAAD